MVNSAKKKFNFFIFIFFVALVFISYRQLFQSYFEADEWFHFTYYLPFVNQSNGFLTTLIKTIADTDPLSRGQHIVPIGEEIFFLNTRFFGTNFTPYAFLSLLLHSINSFLVFLFIKELFSTKKERIKVIFALLGGIFFALTAIPMHAVTWVAFYGQNVLSVTFFILCTFFFKRAFNTKKRKFLYISLLFLFLGLFTKETATVLFILLPFMALIEKRIFSFKYLTKLYIFSLIVFVIFRFVIPNVYLGIGHLADKWVDNYITTANKSTGNKDTGTIVSTDLSIHKNIYAELLFRATTFPIQMTSELFFPRETILSFMHVITPIVYPLPDNVSGDEEIVRSQNYQFFVNGPGNNFLIYLFSIGIFSLLIYLAKQFLKNKKIKELKTMGTGLAIITFGALPLVLIVLSFPRWGYDTYFDSRHYYMPSVGAAILFPFLLFAIGGFLSKIISKVLKFSIPPFLIILSLFFIWFVNNMNIFQANMHIIVELTGFPRKQIITQMKQYLPTLPSKAVIYAETDGKGAYGPLLPFQTSFPQILTVVYYDKNPLPDSFFNTFFLDAKPEGYLYSEGRGLGFYNSKKTLSEALLDNKFSVDDIYGFYYDSQKVKLKDITQSVREEMKDYLEKTRSTSNWKTFQDPVLRLSFNYPPDTQINEISESTESAKVLKSLQLHNLRFSARLKIFNISPTLDINEVKDLFNQREFENAI